jgi:RNA polymerase sigma factor (sigma-70 family)
MATSQMGNVIQQLHKAMLVQEAPDGQLLDTFVSRREATALEALVRRHGPMVWNVCRRVLHNHQDAEDAFQATFLVFVRKAASIVPKEMVGNWLYGVAHHTALKANATTAKRRTREKQVTQMPEPATTEQERWTDLQPILDQEISRLPDNYRAVIVLCDLEGKTRSQAAQQLGWPEGTVAGRLARARTTLAKRLVQRGIVLSGGTLAAVLAQQAASASVPGAVLTTTIQSAALVAAGQAATAAVSSKVAALTEGVMKAMLMAKLKTGAFALLMVGVVTFACGLLAFGMTNANGDGVDNPVATVNEKPKDGVGGNDNTLTVTIEPQKNRIRADEPFNVDVRVVNSSKSPQTIRVMSGSWRGHWKSSNESVAWERVVILKDVEQKVILEPGKAYEKTGAMFLVAGKPQQKVSFKVGFTPIGSNETFWSNEVTLQVEPEAKADARPKDAGGEKDSTLTVTIKPQKDRIRASEQFKVDLRVVNSSKVPQTFRVRIGSWFEHWKSSNERVYVSGWPVFENMEIEITLAPGEADEKTLPMLILAGKSKEKESFKLGFTPIGSKQTFWSNEVTVEVEQEKKEPRDVEIARYPAEERATGKRVRELLDAAKISHSSHVSREVCVFVPDNKAKQARAILEKAVVDKTLSVQVLDQLPMPKNLKAVRTDDKLRIEEDTASNEEVVVPVTAGLIRSTDCELSVYRGKERVSHTGGTYTPPFELTRANSKIPQPGESYEVKLVVKWFETDAAMQPNWKPESGGKYKVLVTRTLKLSIGPENTKPAPAPPNRWEKLLQDKKLTAKQRKAYEQIAKLYAIKLQKEDPTDLLFHMGLDALPMLAEALDDETLTGTVTTQEEGDFKQEKKWKVNDIAALLIVRIADRDFVIGELPKHLGIRDIAQRPNAAPEFRKLVVAWHGKFAAKTPTERKIADISDPWFRNRFDAIISLGNWKAKDARAPIAAHVDAFYADKNREYSTLTRAEMSHCALALGQIGNKADLPQVRKVCKDMSSWLATYGVQDSGMLEDLWLFRF